MIIISKHMAINMEHVLYWVAQTSFNDKGTTLTFRDNKSIYITCDFKTFNDQYKRAKRDDLKVYWLEY